MLNRKIFLKQNFKKENCVKYVKTRKLEEIKVVDEEEVGGGREEGLKRNGNWWGNLSFVLKK